VFRNVLPLWEIIADNLSKAGWSWAVSQQLIPTGERSLSLTLIATTERGLLLREDEKLTAFVELESAVRAADYMRRKR
jgi:hypothetical protein